MTWPADTVQQALELFDGGATYRQVARVTGVPRDTLRNWRAGRLPAEVRLRRSGAPVCGSCGAREHDFADLPFGAYAYLLGLYLGDGCLTAVGNSWSLRIAMDRAYPGIVARCADAVAHVRGRRPSVTPNRNDGAVIVASSWRRWACLFPQHGAGKKHLRPILLSDWQETIVTAAPRELLRGLIHSDGWRGLNRVTVKGHHYAYPRYQFSSRSDDIRAIFTAACDRLGVEWRRWGKWHISVARRDSVASLDTFIGPKC